MTDPTAPESQRLTRRQREVLRAIVKHWQHHGYSPTYREMMDLLGINNINAVRQHVEILQCKGYIHYEDGPAKARNIRPIGLQVLAVIGRDEDGQRLRKAIRHIPDSGD